MTVQHGRIVELTAARTLTVREQAFPPPEPGQVLVRVRRIGICASELGQWLAGPAEGTAPARLGHEPVGVVTALGAGVTGWRTGVPVTGRLIPALADYVYADPADLVAVPEAVDPAVALGEPLGCVAEAYRRCPPALGARTAVVGLGFMGLLLARFLTLSPVAEVSGVDPRPDARAAAAGLGLDRLLTPEQAGAVPESADLVVEATGTQAGLDLATRLVSEHGALSILGYHQGGPRSVDLAGWNWKALTVVNAHVRDRGRLAEATRGGLALAATGRLDLAPLLTHDYPLENVDQAFRDLHEKPAGFVKAVVTL